MPPITQDDTNQASSCPWAPSQTRLLSPKTTLDPSPFLPREMAGKCSQQQPCSRLWDAPGFLPFTKIGVMEDYPPASESRAGSYSALSPQSNLYRPALRHGIFSPPCLRNRQTVFSLALLLGAPLLPGGNNRPLEIVASVVPAAQIHLQDQCHSDSCKGQTIYLMRKMLMRLLLS